MAGFSVSGSARHRVVSTRVRQVIACNPAQGIDHVTVQSAMARRKTSRDHNLKNL